MFPSSRSLKKAELNMARMLVENLAAEWDPGKYADDYQENLMRVIKARMKGKEPDLVVEERQRDSNVIDLMERLRQSLDRSGGGANGAQQRHALRRPRKTRATRNPRARPRFTRASSAARVRSGVRNVLFTAAA